MPVLLKTVLMRLEIKKYGTIHDNAEQYNLSKVEISLIIGIIHS